MTSLDPFDTESLLPDPLPESPFPTLAAWLAGAPSPGLTLFLVAGLMVFGFVFGQFPLRAIA